MHGKLTQPKIDGYISWLWRNDHFGITSCIYDNKSRKLLDELFELLEQVAPESPSGGQDALASCGKRTNRGLRQCGRGNRRGQLRLGRRIRGRMEKLVPRGRQIVSFPSRRGQSGRIPRCRGSSQLCDCAGQAQRTGRMAL